MKQFPLLSIPQMAVDRRRVQPLGCTGPGEDSSMLAS